MDRAPWERQQLYEELIAERFGKPWYRSAIDPCTPQEQARHRRVLCEAMKDIGEEMRTK